MDRSSELPFDVDVLDAFPRARLPNYYGPLRVQRFVGGQSNPTYHLETPTALYVRPPGPLLPSAHAVDREYRVISALRDSGVSMPSTHVYCDDPAVIGTSFFIMDFVEGRVFWAPALPEMARADRTTLRDDINRVVAALHSVDIGRAGLADYGRPGNYFQRQIERWSRQCRVPETEPIPAMDRLIEWLPARIPPGDGVALVHGDLRLDNMIVCSHEPRVVALLDWELSTLGHPLADLSYHLMPWRLTAGEFRGMADKDLPALGIPEERAHAELYCRRVRRAPIDAAQWAFYMVFNMFRLATILQGITKRAIHRRFKPPAFNRSALA